MNTEVPHHNLPMPRGLADSSAPCRRGLQRRETWKEGRVVGNFCVHACPLARFVANHCTFILCTKHSLWRVHMSTARSMSPHSGMYLAQMLPQVSGKHESPTHSVMWGRGSPFNLQTSFVTRYKGQWCVLSFPHQSWESGGTGKLTQESL